MPLRACPIARARGDTYRRPALRGLALQVNDRGAETLPPVAPILRWARVPEFGPYYAGPRPCHFCTTFTQVQTCLGPDKGRRGTEVTKPTKIKMPMVETFPFYRHLTHRVMQAPLSICESDLIHLSPSLQKFWRVRRLDCTSLFFPCSSF